MPLSSVWNSSVWEIREIGKLTEIMMRNRSKSILALGSWFWSLVPGRLVLTGAGVPVVGYVYVFCYLSRERERDYECEVLMSSLSLFFIYFSPPGFLGDSFAVALSPLISFNRFCPSHPYPPPPPLPPSLPAPGL